MYLEHLKIAGFKSFGTETTIEFPKLEKGSVGITAIVGPNGSGKSNIIDAIRWGLGEQSLKGLRSKNFEDIIFLGSQKNQSHFAEVALLFNNEDEAAPIEYSEFTIMRRLFRGGESEYLINNRKVRLQDILFLLAQTNFGQRSYSIVNQGMTDAILQSSFQEKRKFFNEATGVEQYIIKQNETIRKIIKTQQNLEEASIALRELTPRLNSLKRQMHKLQKRQELIRKLRNLQKNYYSVSLSRLKQQIVEKQKNLKIKLVEQAKVEESLAGYEQKMEEFSNESINDLYRETQEKYQKLLGLKNEYLRKQLLIESEIKEGDRKIQTELTIAPEELLKKLKEIKKIAEAKNTTKIKEIIQSVADKIEKLINCFEEEKPETDKENFQDRLNEKEKINKRLEEINTESERLSQKLEHFLVGEKTKREKIVSEQKEKQGVQEQFNNLTNEINEIKIALARIETQAETMEMEIKEEIGSLEIAESANSQAEKNDPPAGEMTSEEQLEEIRRIKRQLELIGGIDPEIEKEYYPCLDRFDFLSSQTQDLKKSINSLKEIIYKLEEKIDTQFKKNFSQINQEFNRFFKIL